MKLVSTIKRHENVESVVTKLSTRHLSVTLGESIVAQGNPLKSRPVEVLYKSYYKRKIQLNIIYDYNII